jgi:hypothetical protein
MELEEIITLAAAPIFSSLQTVSPNFTNTNMKIAVAQARQLWKETLKQSQEDNS